jgi:hypothetical protein
MTLMEVMVVIALILLLTGALMFGLRETMVDGIRDTLRLELGRFAQQIEVERVRHGGLPERLEDAGLTPPQDRAGHAATYTRTGDGFELRLPGEDGRVATDDDVVWPSER